MFTSSTTDNNFLASSYIGTGKKYRNAPDFVHAAFDALSTPPSIFDSLYLPNARLSVLALVAYSLPNETPVHPLPDPLSYFSKEEPHAINHATTTLLQTLPIPPAPVMEKIIRLAGQAWLDGYKSVVYSHTGHDRRCPFWIIRHWMRIAEILPARQAWTAADQNLSVLQKKSSDHIRQAADNFRALLHSLPWHGRICGFSDSKAVHWLAAFTSKDWLTDIHETFMLEELQRQIAAVPEFGTKQVVTNIWISKKICDAYEHRNDNMYPPLHRTELAELGTDLARGTKTRLGMMWFVNHNHWCSMDIIADTLKQHILYGDPMGDGPPNHIREAVVWWLSKHVEGSFEWGTLLCPSQHDGFSCGLLAQNGLAHSFLPTKYPLIDAASAQNVAIARLKAGADVIQHHIQMVCYDLCHLSNYLPLCTSYSCRRLLLIRSL
jgi:hypothetical protein